MTFGSGVALLLAAFFSFGIIPLAAQENYEIQVYPSETLAPGRTMVELHSNFTFSGQKNVVDGMYPTEHALHETLEITQGINRWSEQASTFSPATAQATVINLWAATFVRASASRRIGTGRWD